MKIHALTSELSLYFTGDKALASRSAIKVVTFDDLLNSSEKT